MSVYVSDSINEGSFPRIVENVSNRHRLISQHVKNGAKVWTGHQS
jgi:hypothetical protein